MAVLKGKAVIVTGASSGIGAALARGFSHEGAFVTLAARREDRLCEVARSCPQDVLVVPTDLLQEQDRRTLVRETTARWGRVDILVNNAGIMKSGSLADASVEDWDEVCRVNLSGVFYCSKAVLAPMVERRSGRIVNIASVSASRGGGAIGNVLYGATKAGVVALTKGFARELAPFGITVNAIAPSVADTAMTHSLLTPERRQAVTAAIPSGRLALPADVARMAVILASEVSGYVTGETIAVDGGYLTR